jgi:hypothetical protein
LVGADLSIARSACIELDMGLLRVDRGIDSLFERSVRMRTTICFLVVLGAAMYASAQPATAPKSNWLADSVTQNGATVQMNGHVRIAACGIVTADEAVGGPNASETALSGNVRLKITEGVDPLR